MTHEEKVRSVAKNIEQLCDEVPVFLSLRIEELMSALDERVTWKEWKYLFKLGTSKVVSMLRWHHVISVLGKDIFLMHC